MNMENKPLVSVLVPVYNCEAYLPRCLDSILNQTYTNLQVVLVDDGATDQSGAICDRYAATDSRVKVIHKQNAGVAAARNCCLDAADGAYLMYVDSDDYLSPDAVELLFEAICRDGSQMAIGRHTDIFDDGSTDDSFCKWMTDRVYTNDQLFSMLGGPARPSGALWGKLYSREALRGVRYPALNCGEDLYVLPQILENCPLISVVDRCIYFYYQRSSSIMHVYNTRTQRDDLYASLHVTQYLWEHGYHAAAEKWYTRCIDRAFTYGNTADCRAMFRDCFDKATNRKLRNAQTIKTKVKYFVLQNQLLRNWVSLLKK